MLNFFRRALTSMRLAVVLIAYLIVGCMFATLVPQGLEPASYYQNYKRPIAALVIVSGFSNYFESALFIVPAVLFFLNLAACTIRRFIRARRGPSPRRHGPDILHAGLLLFIIGASLSAIDRQGGVAHLAVGDQVALPDGARLTLDSFTAERYDDGRPKDWTSRVSVARDGKTIVAAFPLRVNHPLAIGNVTLYQASQETRALLKLGGSGTSVATLAIGDSASVSGRKVTFEALGSEGALVSVSGPGKSLEYVLKPGDSVGDIAVQALRQEEVSGIMLVRDSFFGLILLSLAIVAIGLAITFIQKLGEIST